MEMSRSRVVIGIAAILATLSACGTSGTQIKSSSPPSATSTPASSASSTATSAPDVTEPSDSSSTQDPEQFNDMPLGRSITVSGTDNNDRPFEMTVTVSNPRTSKRQQQQYMGPPKRTFLGVRAVYNCTKGLCDYNSFDWTLRAADGTTFDNTLGGGFVPELESGTMHKGARASGYITWDVRPGRYTAEYSTMDNVASWVVNFR